MEKSDIYQIRQALKKLNKSNNSIKRISSGKSELEIAILSELKRRDTIDFEYQRAIKEELHRRRVLEQEKRERALNQSWRINYSDIVNELKELYQTNQFNDNSIGLVLEHYGIPGYSVLLSLNEDRGITIYIEEPSTILRDRLKLKLHKRTFLYNGIWFNSTEDLEEYKTMARLNLEEYNKKVKKIA